MRVLSNVTGNKVLAYATSCTREHKSLTSVTLRAWKCDDNFLDSMHYGLGYAQMLTELT